MPLRTTEPTLICCYFLNHPCRRLILIYGWESEDYCCAKQKKEKRKKGVSVHFKVSAVEIVCKKKECHSGQSEIRRVQWRESFESCWAAVAGRGDTRRGVVAELVSALIQTDCDITASKKLWMNLLCAMRGPNLSAGRSNQSYKWTCFFFFW